MDGHEGERWRGNVDSELRNLGTSLRESHAKNEKLDARQQILELKVQTLATKIGLFASLGAFLGGGAMSIIIGLFVKH